MPFYSICNFQLNSTTTKIQQKLDVPIQLDINKRYMLSVKNIQFSNVFANILESDYRTFKVTYYYSDLTNDEVGFDLPVNSIYTLETIYSLMTDAGNLFLLPHTVGLTESLQIFTVTIDPHSGLSMIVPSNDFLTLCSTHGITNISFHASDVNSIFRGRFFPYNGSISWLGSSMPSTVYSDEYAQYIGYNAYLLTSNLCTSRGYCMRDNTVIRTNFLLSVPNDQASFEFANFVAFQPVESILSSGSNIQDIMFELKTDAADNLIQIPGSTTDFGVFCSILEEY